MHRADQRLWSKPQIDNPEWHRFGSRWLNKKEKENSLPYTDWRVSQRILAWDSSPKLKGGWIRSPHEPQSSDLVTINGIDLNLESMLKNDAGLVMWLGNYSISWVERSTDENHLWTSEQMVSTRSRSWRDLINGWDVFTDQLVQELKYFWWPK